MKTFTQEQLLQALELLEPEDSRLLKLRFGIDEDRPKSMEQLAAIYNLTGEEIYNELRRVERLARKNI
jgi:DNA-directed RNA polymerase sigma subunit (sigma70/sigma32)